MNMSEKTDLLKILSSPVAYYAVFAKIGGGVTAGVFLSQLVYWTGRGKRADGWVWKSAEDMEDETGLTRNEQETARRNLKARGLITERLAGVPATLHFRVDLEAVLLAVAQFGEKCQSGLAKSDKPDSGKAPNLLGENLQTIHRLPETTTETTTDLAADAANDKNAPAENLNPQTEEERYLFQQLARSAGGKGRTPGRARFSNAVQAQTFREAVRALNGRTIAVLQEFFVGGGDGLGHAVRYLRAAARKEATKPPPVPDWGPEDVAAYHKRRDAETAAWEAQHAGAQ